MKLRATGTALAFACFFGALCAETPFAYADCLPLHERTIADPTGLTFKISETDCDAIAKEIVARIYASHAGRSDAALIFEFDPVLSSRPSIAVMANGTIQISVSKISSAIVQKSSWGGRSISYKIGKVIYPAARVK